MDSNRIIRGVALLLFILISSPSSPSFTNAEIPAEGCGNLPADVVFIMDSSSSIKAPDFIRQVDFVRGVASLFDIAPNRTRVGVMSFSNWAYLEFHMNMYEDHWTMQAALSGMEQAKGDTNTADAIAYARDVMFKPHNGARPGLPQIAIVLTDGKSNEPSRTLLEAARARAQGIHVFAIGIGSEVERAELLGIASSPSENYVFQVGDFTALQYIREILAIKTCGVTDPPSTISPSTEPPVIYKACGDAELADIVFAPSPAGSAENTEKSLAFFREVASGLDIDSDRVRVGVVPKECNDLPELSIEQTSDKEAIMKHIDNIMESIPATASQLKYMRRSSFRESNGARPDAKRIAVMIVDAGDDLGRAKYESLKLRSSRNVELFVIGVGKEMNVQKLHGIASEPASQHVFVVSSYDELPMLIYRVKANMCPVTTA